MEDAWQTQDMAPSAVSGISIPTADVSMGNGNGHAAGDDTSYSPGGGRPSGDAPERRSRSRSPVAREGNDRGRGNPQAANPGNNLHVSGLSTKVDTRDLEAAFSKVGRVQKVQIMHDPHTRDSRGFGFVTMETPEEADAAITALNATELFGKTMNVEKARRARARTPTPGRYYGPPKRNEHERPYDPRPYDNRYRGDYDRRGGRGDDYRGGRGDDYRGGRGDDYRGGGRGDDYRGGGRYDDRDRYRDYDRR